MEALEAFINMSVMDEVFVTVRKGNSCAIHDLESLGFKPTECTENTITYRYKKHQKKLEKTKE